MKEYKIYFSMGQNSGIEGDIAVKAQNKAAIENEIQFWEAEFIGAFAALHQEKLERYYKLKGGKCKPIHIITEL